MQLLASRELSRLGPSLQLALATGSDSSGRHLWAEVVGSISILQVVIAALCVRLSAYGALEILRCSKLFRMARISASKSGPR